MNDPMFLEWLRLLVLFLSGLFVLGLVATLANWLVSPRELPHPHRRSTDMPLKYDNELCNQFIEDMEAADLPVFHYRGRWFYQGPAVDVDHLTDAMRHTQVPTQWDNLGRGFVVYPQASGKLMTPEDDHENA